MTDFLKMSDREDNVYKAKLAEQAERYDGKVGTSCKRLIGGGKVKGIVGRLVGFFAWLDKT